MKYSAKKSIYRSRKDATAKRRAIHLAYLRRMAKP
jgi:hypothetical protein